MERLLIESALDRVRAALENNDFDQAIHIIEGLRPPDQAEVFAELEPEDQVALLPQLDPADSADILEELEEEEAAELASTLPTSTLSRIVDEMEPDEAADLLGDISDEQAEAVLASLEDPDEVRPLLMHPDDTAGGLMTSEFLALRRRTTVAEALEAVRQWHPEGHVADQLFVIDANRVLHGVVTLRQLILAEPHQRMVDIMNPEVISVPVGTDQEECARLMDRYDLLALPVVDEHHRLLGVITVDDLVDVLQEEVTEDIQRLGGAQPLGGPYLETNVIRVARSRIGWLLILFLTGTLTGSVLRLFSYELEAVVALAYFIPLLIGTGGNAGSQTISTIVRGLAVGDIGLGDGLRVLWHELRVGLLLGIVMGTVGYIRALTWGIEHPVAIAVALALLMIVLWANIIGSALPLLASRLRIDPAIVSGPFMSTLVDATGLLIYLSVAKAILGI
ncbi:MAG: magnesium transporter [Anaerolineae bacterium]|nr:magnesium transporter [Anaerolineae bacterium]MDW8100175.1 magnesium transporter [Anaerolineae bacterium]